MRLLKLFLKIAVLAGLIFLKLWKEAWWREMRLNYEGINVLLNFVIFALAANVILVILIRLYRRGKRMGRGEVDNVIVGLQNIYYLVLTGAILMTMLGLWGIDYKTLFTSLSIVAAAIAIISKDFISEVISGVLITFSKEVSIGDYIKIGEHKGKIIDLHLNKLALLNEDDDIIFIPNNKVYTSEIVNYTKKQIRKVSIEFALNIQSLKTIEELEEDLVDSLEDFHHHIEPGSYQLRIVEINKDDLSLKFQYILKRRDRDLEREIRKKTARRIVNYVKQNRNLTPPAPEVKTAAPVEIEKNDPLN